MDSLGVKTSLTDDPFKQRKRPYTASPAKAIRTPWSNPNAHQHSGLAKKYVVTLDHKPFQSCVSKKAPFASRPHSASPAVAVGKQDTAPGLPYNPLDDPHLRSYYERKLGVRPNLSEGGKKKSKATKAKSVVSRIPYSVTILTGDKKGAYTNANAFITLRGTTGKVNKHLLQKADNEAEDGPFTFKRNTAESFSVRSTDIGELISVEIEHDGVERTQGWYVEEVIVKNQKSKQTWTLPCQQWMSLYEGDCQVKRVLKPLSSANKQQAERVIYEVSVITGDVRGAGTDAHVFLTIFGARGNTPKCQLINRNVDTFERSKTDVFKIKFKYLGKVDRIIIEHDNAGFAPGWYLEQVVITNTSNPKERWYFVCNKWFSKSEGDGEIARTLLGTKNLENLPAAHKYSISTHTGDVRGAGTDANIYITLFSKDGNTTEMKLNDSKNNFERKKVDTFNVECADIGDLTRVRIRHDNNGLAAGWFLDKVVVRDGSKNSFEFPCSRWLSETEDDGQISRDLILASADGTQFSPGIPYRLHVTTGDIRGAGTSAKVYIIIYGGEEGEKNSGKLWVRNGASDNFERNRTDTFHVECSEELSPAHHVTVGHDNSGVGAGWFLEKILLESPTTGINQTFFCKQWLADDEGDQLIERDLYEDIDYRTQREAKDVWNMKIVTSEMRGAGTDANVSFVLYGDRGKTEETQLASKSDSFERGNADVFKVDVKDVGVPYKLRISHDNSKMYADWHLNKVELENSSTKERYLFTCDRWLGRGEEDGECVRELPAQGGSQKPLNVLQYLVSVYTGDKWGAGTDANVFLNVFGERGDTGERALRKSKTNTNKFERKQVDEFIVEAVDLSKLTSIRIGHDGKGSGDGWYLDKVIVEDPVTKERFPFLCDRWLASNEDDGQIVREIPVGDTATLLKTTSYHVSVKTGDVRGAGTDANVFLVLFGVEGDTGKLQLRQAQNTNDKWERGRTDMFTLEAMHVGKIEKLIIGHDGKGMGAGWFLDSITVDVPSHGHHVKFACNRWLAEDEDDKRIERELYPSEQREGSKKVPYEVEVHTSDIRGSGTNSNVFIVLYGKQKKSEEFWLRSKTDNFERAQVDKFKIESHELGYLTKIRVGHDNAGFGAAWHLDKVIIRRMEPPPKKEKKKGKKKKKNRGSNSNEIEGSEDETGEEEVDDCNYVFPCKRWFAKDEDDGQIVRELVPFDESGKQRKNSLSANTYVLRVFTGDVSGSGTNANVFATIYGSTGDTGERELKKSETNFDKFERKQEDVFNIDALSLGELCKVKIRHDNSGLQSSWFLDRVEVQDVSKNLDYIFPCERWLSKTEGDGALSRELVASDRADYERRKARQLERKKSLKRSKSVAGDTIELEQMAEQTTYTVSVHTGDVSGAGTDANVYVIMYGTNGDSGKVDLKSSKSNKDKFERNQTDLFTCEAVDLGDITKLKVGHDNKGGFAGWYLDSVDVDSPSVGKRWVFPAGRWIDKGKEDGKLEVELFPSQDKEITYEKHVPYEIVIYTSDISGAGSDSNIFIALYGMSGVNTEDVVLTDSKKKRKECFNRGSVDVFVRELADIGDQIDKIRIGHDNKGFGAAWHLHKVEVRKLTDAGDSKKGSMTFTFPCNRWFAKNEEDGQIVRELIPANITEEVVDKQGRVSVQEHRADTMLEMHNYKVHVFTGDVKGAGTDANVFVTLYGENGDTGERQLMKSETYRDKFERKHEDVFAVEAVELGRLHKLVVRHDNSNLGSDWYLERIEVLDTSEDNRNFVFNCERWLAKKKDDGKIKRTLFENTFEGDRTSVRSSTTSLRQSTLSLGSLSSLKRSDSADSVYKEQVKGKMKKAPSKVSLGGASTLGSLLETIPYTVRITTGEQSDQGTDANAFVVLIGTDGVSAKIPLQLVGNDLFAPGSVETFSVESEDVGDIKKIELGHDGYTPKHSWWVEGVEVDVPITGRKYHFPCQCWLGKDKEDGRTSRIFSLDDKKDVQYKPKIPYQVTFYTGDVKNAGTDSELRITLFGENGNTDEITLEKEEDRFERGGIDMVRMDMDNVGVLTKLKVSSNGKGSRPHWYLEKVTFLNLSNEKVVIFLCEDWLSKVEGDKKLVRELPAQAEGQKAIQETTYTINVTTGDIRGCGTDANVYLILFGGKGSSEELALKESSTNKDKFERNNTDVFTFSILSLGPLTKLRVWHDNKFMKAGWFLAQIEVVDNLTQEKFLFVCNRWLAKDEDDGAIMRDLACSQDSKALSRQSLNVTEYEVTLVTSEKKDAGTLHNALVYLIDVDGVTSDELLVKNSTKKKLLQTGGSDTFTLKTKKALEDLKQVSVALEKRKSAKESSSKWHLKHVLVKDELTDTSYLFECNQWLKLSSPVTLECVNIEKSKAATIRESVPVVYDVRVYTADVKGAGTDANVFVTLYGDNGDTGKRELKKKFKDLFERGNMDDFKIECLDLGKLTRLNISHDNKGFGAGWMLERVEVENTTTTHTTVVFPCQQWLDKKKGDKQIARDLYPQ